jgi:hypothetical protein
LLSDRGVAGLQQAAELINWYPSHCEIAIYFRQLEGSMQGSNDAIEKFDQAGGGHGHIHDIGLAHQLFDAIGLKMYDMEVSLNSMLMKSEQPAAMNRKELPKNELPAVNEMVRLTA